MQTAKIAVVGAGSWGTVLAALLARPGGRGALAGGPGTAGTGGRVVLVARDREVAADIAGQRRNPRYLPDLKLPERLEVSASPSAVEGAGVVIMAVPSLWARGVMEKLADHMSPGAVLLSVSKGIEPESLSTISKVATEVLPGHTVAVLSGPNLASEIALGLPAATVVACGKAEVALDLQGLFPPERLRVYTHDDVIGCELAGAVKNVLALGAGMVDGLGAGSNALAAMMTRGLAEMARLGVAMGGHPLTFSGLAGLGDLVLTCTSEASRNRKVGFALAQGQAIGAVLGNMAQVAEGVTTAGPVVALAARYGLEMPICSQVAMVLAGGRTPAEAMGALLGREPGHELAGTPPWPGWHGPAW